MNKEFIQFDSIRDNALQLAARIHNEGFVPDVIYVSLRGGAYLGNVISEYFKMVRRHARRPVFYAAVVARSYSDIRQQERIMIDGWTYSPEHLRSGDRVLLVDDIFDSGRTVNYLVEVILEHGIPREDVKVAVHDYKVRSFKPDIMPIKPDYYCRRHDIEGPEDDAWLHYMSHELVGLTEEEVHAHYGNPEVRDTLVAMLRSEDTGGEC